MSEQRPSEPVKVYATGLSNRSDTVTVGSPDDGTRGLLLRTPYSVATVWITRGEAEQIAAALLAEWPSSQNDQPSVETACTHDGSLHTWREGCPS